MGLKTVAQEKEHYSLINKQCPDYNFENVHYFKSQDRDTVSINSFRRKWVLIDFWTKSCMPCIRSFPKLNEWQKEFKDSVQVLLVGFNGRWNYDIQPFFEGVRAAQALNLPIAYDSVFHKKIGVQSVPTKKLGLYSQSSCF